MENDWIKTGIEGIQKHFDNAPDDDIIRSFCVYTLRMLNAASQIVNTDFFYYTQTALLPVLKLYTEYFIKEVGIYLESASGNEKMSLLEDLESAVDLMTNFYKDITESSNFADKNLLQAIPLKVNIHDYYIKQCSFFTEGLNQLIGLVQKSEKETTENYAVGIHPTVRKDARADILFEKRKESGKVIIIQVPEHQFFDVNILFNCLVHRVFFVLSKRFRQRTLRAECFYKIIMKYMVFELLGPEKDARESMLNTALVEHWLEPFQKAIQEELNSNSEERKYYFSQLKNFYINKLNLEMKEILMNVDQVDVKKKLLNSKTNDSLELYGDEYQKVLWKLKTVRDNICNIFIGDKIHKYVEFVSLMMRDTYADLLMIMTLDLRPEKYVATFRGISAGGTVISLEKDFPTFLRMGLVFLTIGQGIENDGWGMGRWRAAVQTMEVGDLNLTFWKEMFETKQKNKSDKSSDSMETVYDNSHFTLESEFMISIDKNIMKYFIDYLSKCGNEYQKFLSGAQNDYVAFRKRYVEGFDQSVEQVALKLTSAF